MKKINTSFSVLIILGIGIIVILVLGTLKSNFPNKEENLTPSKLNDVKNISYVIDGETFQLINGTAIKDVAPGSATKQTLQIFGEPVYGDLNNDGLQDAAIMLVSNPGGSGAFYYAVLAINNQGSYKATNALLLGDRIAPQNVNIDKGRAVYNYAERKAGEPMVVQPSVGKSLWINYDTKTGQIGEWVKDFEGEVDASKMTLTMKKWEWVKTQMNNGTVTTPQKSGLFTLSFNPNGQVNIGTDCNKIGGLYTVKGKTLTFSKLISTMMYCEGSQEQGFEKTLNNISSFIFSNKGELILEIKMDSGMMIFK